MSSKVQVIGGAFQDAEGNLLANGYLILRLNQDSVVNTSQVCAGIDIRIQLDSDGNAASSTSTPVASDQFVWGNDQLLPVNSFYKMTGYSEAGQPVFGPNNVQIIGNGGTFDLGTITPNTVFSWQPSVQGVLLETNGTPNAVQSILNLTGSGVTYSGGGAVAIASGGGSLPANSSYMIGAGYLSMPVINGTGGLTAGVDNLVRLMRFNLPVEITISKCSITGDVTVAVNRFCSFGIYSIDGLTKLVDSGVFTGNGSGGIHQHGTNSFSPVTLPPGTYWAAQTNDVASGNWSCLLINNGVLPQFNTVGYTSRVIMGRAANPSSVGVLPATLGVVTTETSDGTFALPVWE